MRSGRPGGDPDVLLLLLFFFFFLLNPHDISVPLTSSSISWSALSALLMKTTRCVMPICERRKGILKNVVDIVADEMSYDLGHQVRFF